MCDGAHIIVTIGSDAILNAVRKVTPGSEGYLGRMQTQKLLLAVKW